MINNISYVTFVNQNLILWAIILGILFITMFFVIDYCVKVTGISISSMATRLSVLFPIVLSLAIDPVDIVTIRKIVGFIIVLAAITLISLRDKNDKNRKISFLIPFFTFIGMGLVDSVVKYSQEFYIKDTHVAFFSTLVFIIAAIIGFLILTLKQINPIKNKGSVFLGIILGIFNFGSLFFIIKVLNQGSTGLFRLDGSRIYAINHISIIVISVLIGLIFFKEYLSKANIIGIMLSIIGVYLIF